MQLDRTRIVIRERGWLEILDLALLVLRAYAPAIGAALAAGAAPMMALNAWLLRNWIDAENVLQDIPWQYLVGQSLLIAFELPLATAFITLYLGKALFLTKPQPRELLWSFLHSGLQLFVFQVLLRGLFGICSLGIAIFAVWPYLNEVILLELHPWRGRKGKEPSTYRRATQLHSGMTGDFFGYWLTSLLLSVFLIASFWLSIWFFRGMLFGEWRFTEGMYTVAFPLVAWIVAGYFAIVRYLSYLDLRIRREGWEVELSMRAERARLLPQVV
jgi:hypothetical protein